MNNHKATRSGEGGIITLVLIGLLLSSCVKIIEPKDKTLVRTPVVAKINISSPLCGSYRVTLDGIDITNHFNFSLSPPFQGNLYTVQPGWLTPGGHVLEASAETKQYWIIPTCATSTHHISFSTAAISDSSKDTDYMKQCRAAGVPIPPALVVRANYPTYWEYLGSLNEPGSRYVGGQLQPGVRAKIYAYSDSKRRGACLALLREDGNGAPLDVGLICQATVGGQACFWNKPGPLPMPSAHLHADAEIAIESFHDPKVNPLEFNENSLLGIDGCTTCHRGNNAFIMFPDDPLWAKVLRGRLVTAPGSTFTTQVASSTDTDHAGRPRYIPLGLPNPSLGSPAPGPSSCASNCHERTDVADSLRAMLGAAAGTFPSIPQHLHTLPLTMPPICGGNCYR